MTARGGVTMLKTQKDLPVFPVVYKKESKEVRTDETP